MIPCSTIDELANLSEKPNLMLEYADKQMDFRR